MVKQAGIDVIVDEQIIGAAKMVMDGFSSVTAFVHLCDKYGWTVSSITAEPNTISICYDTELTDEETNQPIIIWKDITAS